MVKAARGAVMALELILDGRRGGMMVDCSSVHFKGQSIVSVKF